MRDSVREEIIKVFRGSGNILVFQNTDTRWFISDSKVLINASFEEIEQILVSLKIVPGGRGRYTKEGKRYTFREQGEQPMGHLLVCSINNAVLAPFLIEGEEHILRPVITEGRTVTFINDIYTPIIRAILSEPKMEICGNDDPKEMLHIVHNPSGYIRETIMVFAPIVVSKKSRQEYGDIFRIMSASVSS